VSVEEDETRGTRAHSRLDIAGLEVGELAVLREKRDVVALRREASQRSQEREGKGLERTFPQVMKVRSLEREEER
jgi:hypothetical protein